MRGSLACLLALLVLLTAGCVRSEGEGPKYAVYYLSEAVDRELALVAETRSLPDESAPIDSLLALLLDGPEDEDLTSAIPGGVTLRGWSLNDGVLTVDFSSRYAQLSGVALTLADYSVVNTLCQLDEVEAVEITAEGDYLTYRNHQRMTPADAWAGDIQEDAAEETQEEAAAENESGS